MSKKPKERDATPIEDLEEGVDLVEEDADPEEHDDLPPPPTGEESPWGDEVDEGEDRDGEPATKIFTLSIPNKEEVDGRKNPGYKKLCLDSKNFTMDPEDYIDCVVLHRIYPNICQVPYSESRSMEPWEKMLGYSFDGLVPSVNRAGELFDECVGPDDVPFFMCSEDPPYDPSKKNQFTPLATDKGTLSIPGNKKKTIKAVGECPKARWGNTLDAKTRKKFGIRTADAKPICDRHIIAYCWHLKYEVLFTAYFKRTSLPSAKAFFQGLTKGFGDERRKYPPRAFIARISVEKKGTYATAKIQNTNQWTNPEQIKPIFAYFNEHKARFCKDQALVLEEKRLKAEKDGEFPPSD